MQGKSQSTFQHSNKPQFSTFHSVKLQKGNSKKEEGDRDKRDEKDSPALKKRTKLNPDDEPPQIGVNVNKY